MYKGFPIEENEVIEYVNSLAVTAEDVAAIATADQGTEKWLTYRKGRLTGSNFGSANGTNKYSSPTNLIKDMLWSTFKGNAATRWGNEHEDDGVDAYRSYRINQIMDEGGDAEGFWIEHTGLVLCEEHPWLGTSPDGIVYEGGERVGLLEIKCPFRKKLYGPIPPYYFDQIQGLMAVLKLKWCDFCVWTPDTCSVQRFPFNAEYWTTILFKNLEFFYFDEYLPRLLMKQKGLLKPGEIDMSIHIGDLSDQLLVTDNEDQQKVIDQPFLFNVDFLK